MPLTHFLGLIALLILSAGVTIALATWSGMPLAAIAFAALSGSMILLWSRIGR